VNPPKVVAVVSTADAMLVDLDCGHRIRLKPGIAAPTTGSEYPCPDCARYRSLASSA